MHTLSLRNGAWFFDLHHQIVAPNAIDLKVSHCAFKESLDQVVVEVGVNPRLFKRIGRRARGAARDKPSFQSRLRIVRKRARGPDVIAMPADKMWTRIAIGLGMNDHNRFANFRL